VVALKWHESKRRKVARRQAESLRRGGAEPAAGKQKGGRRRCCGRGAAEATIDEVESFCGVSFCPYSDYQYKQEKGEVDSTTLV
jgi:hypothetical protein